MDNKTPTLTHINRDGTAHMIDIGDKAITHRIARVSASITMNAKTLEMILRGDGKKGDVIGTARIAGIMAAKKTADLIPLCHSLMLSKVQVEIEADHTLPGVRVMSFVKCHGKTGVEMEALTAASVACLTIYDMAKAVDRTMVIGDLKLIEKSGGASGNFKVQSGDVVTC